MDCYKLVNGKFEPVDPPYGDASDPVKALFDAGYRKELTSGLEEGVGGEVTLWVNTKPDSGKPRFFLDVWGSEHGLAEFVADDLPGLLAVMKEAAPLIALAGLEQRSTIHVLRQLDRKDGVDKGVEALEGLRRG